MSRELICVHVGHSGARIGDAAWALALLEHGARRHAREAPPTGVCPHRHRGSSFPRALTLPLSYASPHRPGLGGDGMEAAAPGGDGACAGGGPESRRVLFDVTAAGKHVPRCLFVDMEARAGVPLRPRCDAR
jgi:hypothetical protein